MMPTPHPLAFIAAAVVFAVIGMPWWFCAIFVAAAFVASRVR